MIRKGPACGCLFFPFVFVTLLHALPSEFQQDGLGSEWTPARRQVDGLRQPTCHAYILNKHVKISES